MSRRYCCVFGCHNNAKIIKEWETLICETHQVIHGLESCDCTVPFFLLSFPTKDKSLREEWIRRINRKDWKPNYDTQICSDHFENVDLVSRRTSKENPYPTLELGYQLSGERKKQKRKPPCHRLNSPPVKRKYTHKRLKTVQDNIPDIESQCNSCEDYKAKTKDLQKQVLHWQSLYYHQQEKRLSLQVLTNDTKVKRYTGLPSKEVFDNLFASFGDKVKKIRKWKGPGCTVTRRPTFHGGKRKTLPIITAKEEYFITLFRTKTMLRGDIVGDLFGISASFVSEICVTWWKFLSRELKPLIYNPSSEAHRELLPESFNTPRYRKVEHIVDCTEVFTETPKNKKVKSILWSHYKHHHTA